MDNVNETGNKLSWDDVFRQALSIGLGLLGKKTGTTQAQAPEIKVDIAGTTKAMLIGVAVILGIFLMLKRG